jgi:hypothetical protein
MVRPYVPEAGDIVWLHFDPQAGIQPSVPAGFPLKRLRE